MSDCTRDCSKSSKLISTKPGWQGVARVKCIRVMGWICEIFFFTFANESLRSVTPHVFETSRWQRNRLVTKHNRCRNTMTAFGNISRHIKWSRLPICTSQKTRVMSLSYSSALRHRKCFLVRGITRKIFLRLYFWFRSVHTSLASRSSVEDPGCDKRKLSCLRFIFLRFSCLQVHLVNNITLKPMINPTGERYAMEHLPTDLCSLAGCTPL